MKKRLLLLFLLLSLLVCGCAKNAPADTLQLYFLDVGQGDSILLRTADGDVLIDAGPDDEQEFLLARLKDLGVRKLSLAVFTHADGDHVGGGDGVLEQIPTDLVWINQTGSEEAADRLWETVEQKEIPCSSVKSNDVFELDQLKLTVLAPFDSSAEGNGGSIVLQVSFGNFRAILTGDCEAETEKKILETYPADFLSCDLLKVAHHGSSTSSGEAFLEVLTPTVAVISCAKFNSYGHPHGEVLQRLEKIGSIILRTDLNGEILVETDGDTLNYGKG